MAQTRSRRNWMRIALIGAFALSLAGNALAVGAAWRLSTAREELFGPAAEQAVFDRATRHALRAAFGAEADRLRPNLHALAAARAEVVRAGAARPFDAAALAAAQAAFRTELDATLDLTQGVIAQTLAAHAATQTR